MNTTQQRADTPPSEHTFPFGKGVIHCNPLTGTVLTVGHPEFPEMSFLLGPEDAFHKPPFEWGTGFLIAGKESARWDYPTKLRWGKQSVVIDHSVLPGLGLRVIRRFGKRWTESYEFTNTRGTSLEIGSLAISTPFRDVYQSAADSLHKACHAHIWTGGAHSNVWAVPMSGRMPGLGLRLTEGVLWSYSIESRNQFVSSHARGHIYLHATDAARSPESFGGQPTLCLAPGQTFRLAWELAWHPSADSFERSLAFPFQCPSLAASIGEEGLELSLADNTRIMQFAGRVTKVRGTNAVRLSHDHSGIVHVDITSPTGPGRLAVLFHRPLRDIVEIRIDYILRNQLAKERDPIRRGAFLPFDTESGLTVNAANWSDWSDGRERVAMPLLLQQARKLGWHRSNELDAALEKYARFCRTHIVNEQGVVVEDSFNSSPHRLYNFPWYAEFFLNQYHLYQREEDALLSGRILEAYYRRGGTAYLAFVDCIHGTVSALRKLGHKPLATRLEKSHLRHALYFAKLGENLPAHEVNYEQSMVAPLCLLLQHTLQLRDTPELSESLTTCLRWLEAFAGRQPHARLRHIAIRHWDGFWFGRERAWGDIFPHYWTVLSAAVYANEARRTQTSRSERYQQMAKAIFRGNLSSFRDDGAATCAFLFPSCVNGNRAHHPDPLANDQDWALVWFLKYPELHT
jgi:hypothetical protein